MDRELSRRAAGARTAAWGLRPFAPLSRSKAAALVAFWSIVALGLWVASPMRTLPSPGEVALALGELWWHRGLGPAFGATLALTLEATAWTVAISLPISYAAAWPALRPVAVGLSKLRFVGLVGLVFPLTLLTGGGHGLKVALLTFGMTTFFVTQLTSEVGGVSERAIDHLRVLGASPGRIFWEGVVRGTMPATIETLRQNLAMGWAMITMVEGIARSEHGLGTLLLDENKHFHLAHVYAVIGVVLVIGLALDGIVAAVGRSVCPYASLTKVKP